MFEEIQLQYAAFMLCEINEWYSSDDVAQAEHEMLMVVRSPPTSANEKYEHTGTVRSRGTPMTAFSGIFF